MAPSVITSVTMPAAPSNPAALSFRSVFGSKWQKEAISATKNTSSKYRKAIIQVLPTSYSTVANLTGTRSVKAKPANMVAIQSRNRPVTASFHPDGAIRHRCQQT